MRRVVESSMVYHLWANQSQSDARNSKNNCSFTGDYAYSYAAIIARWIKHKGKKCVLFADRRWSLTTDRHQADCHRAVLGLDVPVFTVSNLADRYSDKIDHKRNLQHYQDEIEELTLKAHRARSNKAWRTAQLNQKINEANAYAKFFGLKKQFKTADYEKLREQIAKRTEAEKKRDHKRQLELAAAAAKQVQEYNEKLVDWIAGKDVQLPRLYNQPISLRIRGSRLETTEGAVVSIEAAMKVLPLVRANAPWHANGEQVQVEHFWLREVTAEGDVRVGCHYVKRAEIERIAAILGK